MILRLQDGPMNGAVYHLDNGQPNTTRKPSGLWFDAFTDSQIPVRHQYVEVACNACREEHGEGVELLYAYEGTNLEWDRLREAAAERAVKMVEAARLRNPAYVPTLDEALGSPDAFVDGMTEE